MSKLASSPKKIKYVALVGKRSWGLKIYGPYKDFDTAAEKHRGPYTLVMRLESKP